MAVLIAAGLPTQLMHRAAFTQDECAAIVSLFVDHLEVARDARTIPNLPRMPADYSVARTNRFDADGALMRSGRLDWVYERILGLASQQLWTEPGEAPAAAEAFHAHVEFNLLHEFQQHDQFGWHVDTKPADGHDRTLNINVMLSSAARGEYTGGALQVGATNVSAEAGDLYLYPASEPHVVHPLSSGLRRTLVIALKEPASAASAQGGGGAVSAEASAPLAERRRRYWSQTRARFEALAGGALAHEPKLHMLFGEFLEASGDAERAKAAFCASYRAAGADAAAAYAAQFLSDAEEAAGVEEALPALLKAGELIQMADCIVPGDAEVAAASERVTNRILAVVAAGRAKQEL